MNVGYELAKVLVKYITQCLKENSLEDIPLLATSLSALIDQLARFWMPVFAYTPQFRTKLHLPSANPDFSPKSEGREIISKSLQISALEVCLFNIGKEYFSQRILS